MEETGIPDGTAPASQGDVEMAQDQTPNASGEADKKDVKLEDLFDDDDSDDEFPGSAPVQPSSQMVPGSPT